jgi:hypothetical protein
MTLATESIKPAFSWAGLPAQVHVVFVLGMGIVAALAGKFSSLALEAQGFSG